MTDTQLLSAVGVTIDGITLKDVAAMSIEELMAIPGIGRKRAERLKAAFEIGFRYAVDRPLPEHAISSPQDVVDALGPRMRALEVEEFHVLLLSNSGRILEDVTVSKGILNASLVHPREVFKQAIKRSAASVILMHNHPSGVREASREDHGITKQLVEGGKLLDIHVQDHIIICGESYVSFAENGWL